MSESTLPNPATTNSDSTKAAPAPEPTARQKADAMDAMHEKGVKVCELTAEEIQWEVEPPRRHSGRL